MYTLSQLQSFSATPTPEKRRVDVVGLRPEESAYFGTTWKPFYTGAVYSNYPSERTMRFVNAQLKKNYPYTPATAEAYFKPDGSMDYMEVFAPFLTDDPVADAAVEQRRVLIPVRVEYGDYLIRETSFLTPYLSEASVKFLNAWVGSRYHWSDKYKYELWKPKSTMVRLDAETGRPSKIIVQVIPSDLATAKDAKQTYLAMQ